MRSKSSVMAFIAGLAAALPCTAEPDLHAGGAGHHLDMRTGLVDTSVRQVGLERFAGHDTRVVIQLDGPMTPERRTQLNASGIELGEYLPKNAYIARLIDADAAAVANLGFVRWHAPYSDDWKIDPEIGHRAYVTEPMLEIIAAGQLPLVVTLFPGESHADAADALANVEVRHVHFLGDSALMHVVVAPEHVDAIASLPAVQFIEPAPEITFRNSTNRWIVQSNINGNFPLYNNGLHGEGQIVGELDGLLDMNHCSFSDTNPIGPTHRKIVAYNTTPGADFHGTHVGGTVVGDNGVDNDTRGVAYLGKVAFHTVPAFNDSAIYSRLSLHSGQGATIHTNSWGNDGTTSYDSLARGFDRFQYDFEDDLVLLAVTNTSTLRNPENAKNLLACGASQDTPNQGNHCTGGTGPTADGRRKPEIYAPGCGTQSSSAGTACGTTGATGTSMATPALAGTAMLMRQYYTDGYYPSGAASGVDALTPSGALVKATMLNSAVDMTGVSGYPSNSEGWGRVLADNSLFFPGDTRKMLIEDVRNGAGLSTGQSTDVPVNVLGSGEQLRVTVVWTEPPATAGSGSPTINDLDLEVISPNNDIYRGNVFSGGQSVTGGSADPINNVEQVHVSNPMAGSWIARVSGTAVNQGTQGFAVVVTGDIEGGSLGVRITLDNGAPDIVAPGVVTTIPVTITTGEDSLVAGSELLHFNYGSGWQSAPLVSLGGTSYEAHLPAASCSDTPLFYVEAEGVTSGVITVPLGGQAAPFAAVVGEIQTLVSRDFESNQGWTGGVPGDTATTGVWVRVDPNGTAAQPEDDHSDPGTQCWVTGQGSVGGTLGENDVDGGTTTLLSDTFDLSSNGGAMISYWRWYSNNTGAAPNADTFVIDISNNGGTTWTNVETVGPTGDGTGGGWMFHEFDPSALVSLTDQMVMRFIASDLGAGSLVEAAIDDFMITEFVCNDPGCTADWNGDGNVNTNDFIAYLNDYNAVLGGGTPTFGDPDLAAPFGVLNSSDFIQFLNDYNAGC